MSKIVASSVFGLVAVPAANPTAARDKRPIKASKNGGRSTRDKRMLVATLATIALVGVAASIAVAITRAVLPFLQSTTSTAGSGYRSDVARFCGIDRISHGCVGHARHPWFLKQ